MNCCSHQRSNEQNSARPIRFLILGMIALPLLATASEPVRLTSDGTNKRDPRFINDGNTLIFCYDQLPNLVRMMKMDLNDREPVPVFEDAGDKHHIEPAVSRDGRFIAYTQCTGNLSARLVVRDQQEQTEAYVTHKGRGGTRSPVFSPDSKLVVYAFAETGPQQLWSITTDGKNKKQLTQTQGISNWPTFTPDGDTLVFSNSRENNYEIYSMSLDGTRERRLTHNSCMDIRPAVSPDGKRVAFTSTRDGNYEVYVMNIDGTDVQRITQHEERDDFPNWHPNGRQVVVVSERDGMFDLYLVDVPGRDVAAK